MHQIYKLTSFNSCASHAFKCINAQRWWDTILNVGITMRLVQKYGRKNRVEVFMHQICANKPAEWVLLLATLKRTTACKSEFYGEIFMFCCQVFVSNYYSHVNPCDLVHFPSVLTAISPFCLDIRSHEMTRCIVFLFVISFLLVSLC